LGLVLSAVAINGCCCGKRESELCSPTDIRKTQFWCLGEDALFHYPCGPRPEFYGAEPTCWREWPTSGAEWRDGGWGAPCSQPAIAAREWGTAPSNVQPPAAVQPKGMAPPLEPLPIEKIEPPTEHIPAPAAQPTSLMQQPPREDVLMPRTRTVRSAMLR